MREPSGARSQMGGQRGIACSLSKTAAAVMLHLILRTESPHPSRREQWLAAIHLPPQGREGYLNVAHHALGAVGLFERFDVFGVELQRYGIDRVFHVTGLRCTDDRRGYAFG